MPYLGNEVAPLVQALEGKELKLDSDGDSSIQASTDDTVVFKTNSNTVLNIDANGHITKPLQSAFLVTKSSAQNNFAVNTENTVIYDTERFDQNGDFASNTFTAPVTGRYQLNTMNFMGNIDAQATYYSLRIRTSNLDYFGTAYSPSSTDSDPVYWVFSANVLVDMDANDTAYVTLYQPNGTAQTDVDGSHVCSFSGYLVC